MVANEILSEELLQQAVSKLATALIDNLPPPYECRHNFSDKFEQKMQSLFRGIGTKCYTVAIQNSVIRK